MSIITKYRKSGGISAAYPVVAGAFADDYSLSFDGTEYATFDQDALDIGTSNISISYWMKCGENDSQRYILNAGNSLFTNQISALIDAGDKAQFSVRQGLITFAQQSSTSQIDDDNWHHILWSHDRDGSSVIYIDGSADDTETLTDSSSWDIDVPGEARVGAVAWSSFDAYKWIGNLNDIAIWNTNLSANDASSIYNSGSPNDLTSASSYDTDRTSNLLLYWKMEEGTGTTVADSSGNGHTLTFVDGSSPSWSSTTP